MFSREEDRLHRDTINSSAASCTLFASAYYVRLGLVLDVKYRDTKPGNGKSFPLADSAAPTVARSPPDYVLNLICA